MIHGSSLDVLVKPSASKPRLALPRFLFGALGALGLALLSGCQTTPSQLPPIPPEESSPVLTIREGDVLKVSFPSAPNLDTTQQVRRDGRITMTLGGEVLALGLTPPALEQELLKTYGDQLVAQEVLVSVVSSSYPVFVNGAVVRPGKIVSDRPLSALEAIMEAGGFDSAKANMRAVVIVRQSGNSTKSFTINLQEALEGKQTEPFFLKPSDIVYVPTRITWF